MINWCVYSLVSEERRKEWKKGRILPKKNLRRSGWVWFWVEFVATSLICHQRKTGIERTGGAGGAVLGWSEQRKERTEMRGGCEEGGRVKAVESALYLSYLLHKLKPRCDSPVSMISGMFV